jgi:hypothetical protein
MSETKPKNSEELNSEGLNKALINSRRTNSSPSIVKPLVYVGPSIKSPSNMNSSVRSFIDDSEENIEIINSFITEYSIIDSDEKKDLFFRVPDNYKIFNNIFASKLDTKLKEITEVNAKTIQNMIEYYFTNYKRINEPPDSLVGGRYNLKRSKTKKTSKASKTKKTSKASKTKKTSKASKTKKNSKASKTKKPVKSRK